MVLSIKKPGGATTQFTVVHRKPSTSDLTEESDFRNMVNYTPFQGFVEVNNPQTTTDFINMYNNNLKASPVGEEFDAYLDKLSALSSDSDFQYFARSILRLLFIAEILKRIATRNNGFRAEWQARLPLWQTFMSTCVTNAPPQNYIEDFRNRLILA